MLKYDLWYFSCTLYRMSSSLVKYEVVHVCFSCCFEIGKMLLARLDNWKKKVTLECKDNSMKNLECYWYDSVTP